MKSICSDCFRELTLKNLQIISGWIKSKMAAGCRPRIGLLSI